MAECKYRMYVYRLTWFAEDLESVRLYFSQLRSLAHGLDLFQDLQTIDPFKMFNIKGGNWNTMRYSSRTNQYVRSIKTDESGKIMQFLIY